MEISAVFRLTEEVFVENLARRVVRLQFSFRDFFEQCDQFIPFHGFTIPSPLPAPISILAMNDTSPEGREQKNSEIPAIKTPPESGGVPRANRPAYLNHV
jgi:hypothetical protein